MSGKSNMSVNTSELKMDSAMFKDTFKMLQANYSIDCLQKSENRNR